MPRKRRVIARREEVPRIISREDAARLLAGPDTKRTRSGIRNRVVLQLMYRAGLRPVEVCRLTPDDVREGFIVDGDRMWIVRRCAGRAGSGWHNVLVTPDEQRTRTTYAKLHHDMRQGGVELIAPDGNRVAYDRAPRLRTRW